MAITSLSGSGSCLAGGVGPGNETPGRSNDGDRIADPTGGHVYGQSPDDYSHIYTDAIPPLAQPNLSEYSDHYSYTTYLYQDPNNINLTGPNNPTRYSIGVYPDPALSAGHLPMERKLP